VKEQVFWSRSLLAAKHCQRNATTFQFVIGVKCSEISWISEQQEPDLPAKRHENGSRNSKL